MYTEVPLQRLGGEAAKVGGMFSQALLVEGQKPERDKKFKAIEQVINYLKSHNVKSGFTYNTSSDSRCPSELCEFEWYDILSMTVYRRYNPAIPPNAKCCGTSQLKSGYRVEDMMVMFGKKVL